MNKKTKYLHILFAFVNAQKKEKLFSFLFFRIEYPTA